MEELTKWAKKYKCLCIFTGCIGCFLAPFLWPFFLAIIFQSLSLAAPILAAAFIIRTVRREKENEKCNYEQEPTSDTNMDSKESVSDGKNTGHSQNAAADSIPKRQEEKRTEPLKKSVQPEQRETECEAIAWYQVEGRERIRNLMKKLEKEHIRRFSINPEGVCCVPEGKRFRRIGALRAYPYQETDILAKQLREDRIHAVKKGKYLWLSWERSVRG